MTTLAVEKVKRLWVLKLCSFTQIVITILPDSMPNLLAYKVRNDTNGKAKADNFNCDICFPRTRKSTLS